MFYIIPAEMYGTLGQPLTIEIMKDCNNNMNCTKGNVKSNVQCVFTKGFNYDEKPVD